MKTKNIIALLAIGVVAIVAISILVVSWGSASEEQTITVPEDASLLENTNNLEGLDETSVSNANVSEGFSEDQWVNAFSDSLREVEEVFACMEKIGINADSLMERYFDCAVDNCMDIAMSDAEMDECIDQCIAPMEKEFVAAANNATFRSCVEAI